MQEYTSAPRQGGAAFIWTWGATSGLILGLLQGIIALFSLGIWGTVINVLIWLIGFFLIGMLAARETGKAGTSALIGLVAGLVAGIIGVIVGSILLQINGPQITAALNQAGQNAQSQGRTISASQLQNIARIAIIIGFVFSVILELGFGAGLGALGGLVGRRQSRSVSETMPTPPPAQL